MSTQKLATHIEVANRPAGRTADDFKADIVRWYLANSEDGEDVGWMLSLARVAGLGVAGVMLYMFTSESLWQYAVLSAVEATPRLLMTMIFIQAALCGLLGTGLRNGLCAIVGRIAGTGGYPFRMMWFTPLLGGTTVVLVRLLAAAVSAHPVLKLQPMAVFERR